MPDSLSHAIGRVSIVPKGAHNPNTSYNKLDVVMYDGNGYIAKKDVPTGIAITNTTYWMEMVSHGTPSDAQVSSAVDTWAATNIDTTSGYVIDNTLSIPNFAADAKAVGDLWDDLEAAHAAELTSFNAAKAEEFNKIVMVSDENPNEPLNKIWVEPDNSGGVTVPEMSDIELMVVNIFAPAYNASEGIYAVGDYVTRNRMLYKATANISQAEAWDSTKWSAVNFSDEIKNLVQRITALEQSISPNPGE